MNADNAANQSLNSLNDNGNNDGLKKVYVFLVVLLVVLIVAGIGVGIYFAVTLTKRKKNKRTPISAPTPAPIAAPAPVFSANVVQMSAAPETTPMPTTDVAMPTSAMQTGAIQSPASMTNAQEYDYQSNPIYDATIDSSMMSDPVYDSGYQTIAPPPIVNPAAPVSPLPTGQPASQLPKPQPAAPAVMQKSKDPSKNTATMPTPPPPPPKLPKTAAPTVAKPAKQPKPPTTPQTDPQPIAQLAVDDAPSTGALPSGAHTLGIPPIPFKKGGGDWNVTMAQSTQGTLTLVNDGTFQVVYPANCGAPKLKRCGSSAGMNGRASPKCCFPTDNVTFGYEVYFAPDFNFQNAGKLPGIWIGDESASGGDWKPQGGSVRVMWRTVKGKNPHAVAYVYFPTEVGGSQDATVKMQNVDVTTTGSTGVDIWRAAKGKDPEFPLITGQWNQIALSVGLNTPGQSNGSLTLSVNGNSKTVQGLTWRKSNIQINGIMLSSWFGGTDIKTYGSPKDETAQFRNFWVL